MISKCRSCSPAASPPTKGTDSQDSWVKLTALQQWRSHCPSLCWCISITCSLCFAFAKFLALQHRATWLIMPVNSYSPFCCARLFVAFLQVLSSHSAFKSQNWWKDGSESTWPDTLSSQSWFSQLTPKAPREADVTADVTAVWCGGDSLIDNLNWYIYNRKRSPSKPSN